MPEAKKVLMIFALVVALLIFPSKPRAQQPRISNIVDLGIISVLGSDFQQGAVVNFYGEAGGFIESVYPFWVSSNHLVVLPPQNSFYLQVINPPFRDQSASPSFRIPESLRPTPVTPSTTPSIAETDFSGRYFIRYYPSNMRIIRNTTSLSDYDLSSSMRYEFSLLSESWRQGNVRFEQEGTNLRIIDETSGEIDSATISGNRFTFGQTATGSFADYPAYCAWMERDTVLGTISNGIISGEVRAFVELSGSTCPGRGWVIEAAYPFDGHRL